MQLRTLSQILQHNTTLVQIHRIWQLKVSLDHSTDYFIRFFFDLRCVCSFKMWPDSEKKRLKKQNNSCYCCSAMTLPEAVLWKPANQMSVLGAVPSTDTCRWPTLSPGGYQRDKPVPGATADWSFPTTWRLRHKRTNTWTGTHRKSYFRILPR